MLGKNSVCTKKSSLRREHAGVSSETDTKRGVLKTEAGEMDRRDSGGVTDTESKGKS